MGIFQKPFQIKKDKLLSSEKQPVPFLHTRSNSEPVKKLPEFVGELRKWGNGKGEKKGEKGHSAYELPRGVEGRLIIQWSGMPEAEENDEDQ
jgi:hypothetical protein